MQAGLGRAQRDAERVGGLRYGQPQVVAEHDEGSLLGFERGQSFVEHLSVEHLLLCVGRRTPIGVQQLDLDHATPAAPRSLDR